MGASRELPQPPTGPFQPHRPACPRWPAIPGHRHLYGAGSSQSEPTQHHAQPRDRRDGRAGGGVDAPSGLPTPACWYKPRAGSCRNPSRGGAGRLLRLPCSDNSRIQPLFELGGVVPAGGGRKRGSVPRPLRVHAPESQVAPDHARRLAGHSAGDHRHHHHRISCRSSPPSGSLWQRCVDHCRGEHQGIQRLRDRRLSRRLCRTAASAQADCLWKRGGGPSGTTKKSRKWWASTRPSSSPSCSSSARSSPPWPESSAGTTPPFSPGWVSCFC